MVIVENPTYSRVMWEGDLIEAPVTRLQYGKVSFRPIMIHVTYDYEDGQWIASNAKIIGPQHKKDGTDGTDFRDNSYYMPLQRFDDTPDWVRTIVSANIPKEVISS